MEEKIFEPKYPISTFVALFIMLPVLLFFFVQSVLEGDVSSGAISALLISVFIIWFLLYVVIAAISFSNNDFTIERYLFPDITIEYSDILFVNDEIIKTSRGSLFIRFMKNSEELVRIFRKYIKKGDSHAYKSRNDVVEGNKVKPLAVILPLIISAGLLGLTFLIWPYDFSILDKLATPLFFVISIMLFAFLKDRI
jgi:hypothetical protein